MPKLDFPAQKRANPGASTAVRKARRQTGLRACCCGSLAGGESRGFGAVWGLERGLASPVLLSSRVKSAGMPQSVVNATRSPVFMPMVFMPMVFMSMVCMSMRNELRVVTDASGSGGGMG